MWTAIITAISELLTSVFALVGSAFSGVVTVFYDGGPTVLLQAIIFVAAASLVGAAIYVIARLIKGALARIRGAMTGAK